MIEKILNDKNIDKDFKNALAEQDPDKQIKEQINLYKKLQRNIIEFSELGDFVYKPVSSYSSGMYSKLAFSITAILETDIMLIDEVLSVGDEKFKKKSYNKMKELPEWKDAIDY